MRPLMERAKEGSQTAVDRILRIMERRAKLLGLDAPTKIAPTDPSGEHEYSGIADDLQRRLAVLAATIGAAGVHPEPE